MAELKERQFTLEHEPIPEPIQEDKIGQALTRLRANNAIYFHSSEGIHHFLLKCAVCFVLERLGKQFQTEKPVLSNVREILSTV